MAVAQHAALKRADPDAATTRRCCGTPGGNRYAENAQTPEDDPQKLFTQACLNGLRAKLCEDVDALDRYLPPSMAAMARRVADAVEAPQPAA
ncbi:hypothetical protein AB0C70_18205 [Streptomyces sp. NPDC048564]|uniref:hypothetical protein n=1 Tax=Streptomyces sp. NPDC048564 TaxID=3155760 RepID=UPI00343182EA